MANGNSSVYSPIVKAIRNAEENSTGKVRVHLSKRWFERNMHQRAIQLFQQYNLIDTPARNSVLVYINLRKRKFEILGDLGFKNAVEARFWHEIAVEMTDNLRSTECERAIALTVDSIGNVIKKHFPSQHPIL